MYKYFLLFFSIMLFAGCSKNESTQPAQTDIKVYGYIRGELNGTSWYSDIISVSKKNNTTYIKAVKILTDNPTYSSTEINFRLINISQPVGYAIGEDEPGYVYAVKADYTLKAKAGNDNVFKVYYLDYSRMTISRVNDQGLNADFHFKAYNDSFTDSVEITSGKIELEFK
ncbi:MAG: hypothetical protein K8H86_02990 [Ignavibacteriaceae bacterium]|nr:hypothetical protein [Ignavibacteriaceae bacterium]